MNLGHERASSLLGSGSGSCITAGCSGHLDGDAASEWAGTGSVVAADHADTLHAGHRAGAGLVGCDFCGERLGGVLVLFLGCVRENQIEGGMGLTAGLVMRRNS